jgi:hypothetical protein
MVSGTPGSVPESMINCLASTTGHSAQAGRRAGAVVRSRQNHPHGRHAVPARSHRVAAEWTDVDRRAPNGFRSAIDGRRGRAVGVGSVAAADAG